MPTSGRSIRRRGKRGGKRHKSKETSGGSTEGRPYNSIGALCTRIAALRLRDDESSRPGLPEASTRISSATSTKSTSFDVDRPRWAPQFLPNSTAAATNPTRTVVISGEHMLPSESPLCQKKVPQSEPCRDAAKAERKNPQFLPLSAFLSCPDPSGRYPSKSRFLEARCAQKNLHCPEFFIPSTSAHVAQNAATSAAYCASASKSVGTDPIESTYDSDGRQEKPACPALLIQVSNTFRPILSDSPTRLNMPHSVSTVPSIHLALSTAREIANGESQISHLTYGLGRERPYLDDTRTIANPRFHGFWQHPLVAAAPDTFLACNNFPSQTRNKSKFFADGQLIIHGGVSASQQPVAEALASTDTNTTTCTDFSTPKPPKDRSHSPVTNLYDRLETKRAWNADCTLGAQPPNLVTAVKSSLDHATSSGPYDREEPLQRISSPLESRLADSDPPIQDYRYPVFSTVCRLETDVEDSISDSDVSEYDIISPVFSQDTWVELSKPPHCTLDMTSISGDECDEENGESYCEPYWTETPTACTDDTQWNHDRTDMSTVEWPTVQEAKRSEHARGGGSPCPTADDDGSNYWDGVTDWFM